jgi:hypothetical protein
LSETRDKIRVETPPDPRYKEKIEASTSSFIDNRIPCEWLTTEVKSIVKESKEEGAHCFAIDFFKL